MVKRKIAILTVCFVCAAGLILYPFISNIYNNWYDEQMVAEYAESISEIEEEDYSEILEAAQVWNEEIYAYVEPSYFPDGLTDSEIYESLLNVNGDGMMGYIIIPKIDVYLPIYHYTTEDVLLKGAGHLAASALPIGGENTHCVITAHRGLPTATMFTDLDKLEIGDVFYLKVLNETLCYEVIEIETIDPDETESLLPVSGEDLCTLVTCTPYGINTQRLLVTGTRVEYDEDGDEDIEATSSAIVKTSTSYWYLIVIFFAEMLLYIILLANTIRNRYSKISKF